MANSYVEYSSSGPLSFVFNKGYLAKSDVHVYVEGVETTDFTWTDDSTVLLGFVPQSNPFAVRIQRETTIDARLVTWADGGSIPAPAHNKDSLQTFYVAQETTERVLRFDNLDSNYDAESRIIKNLADAVANTDATTLQQITALINALALSQGNMPLSGTINNMLVSDGANWAVKSAVDTKTALGLGSAAESAITDFASAAQGIKADSATQSGDLGTAAGIDVGTGANEIIQIDATGKIPALNAELLTNLLTNRVVHIQDQKPSGTSGGTFTSGAWRTRDLNTIVSDPGGHATLAGNQITLAAGTWLCDAFCPASYIRSNQAKLVNVTDASDLIIGSSEWSYGSWDSTIASRISGVFTINVPKVIELQHQCALTWATKGFGSASSFGTEIYSDIVLTKLD